MMDRALKERIIGAVVLVAIVVLVVPVFLDGPATEEEMISEPVLLPGQSREPGARKTVVLQRDRDEPLPDGPAPSALHPGEGAASRDAPSRDAASTPESVEDKDSPQTAGPAPREAVAMADTREPEPEPKPEPEPESELASEGPAEAPAQPANRPETAEAESTTGMWAVQLGSFSNKANADRLAASLRADGYAAFLSQHRTASGEVHRVRIGPQKDRASAEAVAKRLGKGQVVPHP